MLELERTFLAKYLPENLAACKNKEIVDLYLPKEGVHPILRLRKNGDKFELTKKVLAAGNDASQRLESTIELTATEFATLSHLPGKTLRKRRYSYPYKNYVGDIDVFEDALKGLVVVEFEFSSLDEMRAFVPPEFCLADVTQKDFAAGGMLCGKRYRDIEQDLKRFGYKKL